MSVYKAKPNQSIYDICLMTYGSLDYLRKLVEDSGLDNIDSTIELGHEFYYDETIVENLNSSVQINNLDIDLSTKYNG